MGNAECRLVAAGNYDAFLLAFAAAAKADGRSITVRPLHEFNGGATAS
jgi:hypothetical protein